MNEEAAYYLRKSAGALKKCAGIRDAMAWSGIKKAYPKGVDNASRSYIADFLNRYIRKDPIPGPYANSDGVRYGELRNAYIQAKANSKRYYAALGKILSRADRQEQVVNKAFSDARAADLLRSQANLTYTEALAQLLKGFVK